MSAMKCLRGMKGGIAVYVPRGEEAPAVKAGDESYSVKSVIVQSRKTLKRLLNGAAKTSREWRRIRVKGRMAFVQTIGGKITLHKEIGRMRGKMINRPIGPALATFAAADVEGLAELPTKTRTYPIPLPLF